MDILKDLGYNLSEYQTKQFAIYYDFLIEYNKKVNLTRITEETEVYYKHFYDSLLLDKAYNFKKGTTLLDIGAGAGFPSIPLKIMYPDIEVTIVDSTNKRIVFLQELCCKLDIKVNLVSARAEEYIEHNRESFDLVTARAVARLNILSELCIPYVKIGGYFIALKGKNTPFEVAECEKTFESLGAISDGVIKYNLRDYQDERYLVKVKKVRNTYKEYPRIFGKIKKRPL